MTDATDATDATDPIDEIADLYPADVLPKLKERVFKLLYDAVPCDGDFIFSGVDDVRAFTLEEAIVKTVDRVIGEYSTPLERVGAGLTSDTLKWFTVRDYARLFSFFVVMPDVPTLHVRAKSYALALAEAYAIWAVSGVCPSGWNVICPTLFTPYELTGHRGDEF